MRMGYPCAGAAERGHGTNPGGRVWQLPDGPTLGNGLSREVLKTQKKEEPGRDWEGTWVLLQGGGDWGEASFRGSAKEP